MLILSFLTTDLCCLSPDGLFVRWLMPSAHPFPVELHQLPLVSLFHKADDGQLDQGRENEGHADEEPEVDCLGGIIVRDGWVWCTVTMERSEANDYGSGVNGMYMVTQRIGWNMKG